MTQLAHLTGTQIEDFDLLWLQLVRQQSCGPPFWNGIQNLRDRFVPSARRHPKLMLSIIRSDPDQVDVCFMDAGHVLLCIGAALVPAPEGVKIAAAAVRLERLLA